MVYQDTQDFPPKSYEILKTEGIKSFLIRSHLLGWTLKIYNFHRVCTFLKTWSWWLNLLMFLLDVTYLISLSFQHGLSIQRCLLHQGFHQSWLHQCSHRTPAREKPVKTWWLPTSLHLKQNYSRIFLENIFSLPPKFAYIDRKHHLFNEEINK